MTDFLPILLLIGVIALVILGLVFYFKNFKRPRIPAVYCITGAVKTRKSFLSVAFATKIYKKNLRMFYFKKIIKKMLYYVSFKKLDIWKDLEEPMFYTNMYVRGIRFNKFTIDILLRKVRIPHKSVVLLDEVSLIADSMLYKDADINEQLTEFLKLYGHSTWGGSMIFNTHSIADAHFSFKRGCGRFMYLYDGYKVGPFTIVEGMELINNEDNQSGVNSVVNGDVQKNCYKMLFSNKYYKMYDCYYLSILTDTLPVYVDYDARVLNKHDNIKIDKVVTLQKWDNLDRRDLEA